MRLNNNICQEKQLVKVRYDLTSESKFRPYTDRNENFVFLPVQHTLTFEPHELCLVDLGVQLIIPDDLYGVIRQTAPDTLALYTHSGVHPENTTMSFKVYIKNTSNLEVIILAGEPLVSISICSNNRCNWLGENKEERINSQKKPIGILHEEPSLLHAFFKRTAPTELNLFNLLSINVPRDEYSRQSILESIRNLDEIQVHNIVSGSTIPIRSGDIQRDTEIESFTRQIGEKRL